VTTYNWGSEWQASSGTTPLATTASTPVQAAQPAGTRNYVAGLQLFNSSTTVSTTVSLLDGSTLIWTGFLPAQGPTATAPSVYEGTVVQFLTPLKGSKATALNIQCGTTGSSIYWNVQGYFGD
jgi:hypothetical protein